MAKREGQTVVSAQCLTFALYPECEMVQRQTANLADPEQIHNNPSASVLYTYIKPI